VCGGYQFRSPARIEKVLDPATQQLVAYTLCCEIGALERVVWLDGRPHPPEYAERTWEGFSTGRWVGNTLTVTTTHLRTSFLERNGVVAHQNTIDRMLRPPRGGVVYPEYAVARSSFITPDKQMHFNGEAIELWWHPSAHTNADVLVYFRRSDVIVGGDYRVRHLLQKKRHHTPLHTTSPLSPTGQLSSPAMPFSDNFTSMVPNAIVYRIVPRTVEVNVNRDLGLFVQDKLTTGRQRSSASAARART
jgi:hypothetical protein